MANKRTRAPNALEVRFSMRSASRTFVGYSDPTQEETDYDKHSKHGYARNLTDRDSLHSKIGANYDARSNLTGVGCRLHSDYNGVVAAIAEKEKSFGGQAVEQDTRDAATQKVDDLKHAEKIRKATVALHTLKGGSIHLGGAHADRRDARKDKAREPESEYEGTDASGEEESESDHEIEVKSVKKSKTVARPEKKGKEVVEDRKEITTKKAPGFLASFFGLSTKEKPEDDQTRVCNLARLAFHVSKLAPDYRFNEEEQHALACLKAFPQWMSAPTSTEEGFQIMQAIWKHREENPLED